MALLTYKGKKFWIHDYWNNNLNNVLTKAIPNKWDCFGIIFGREGVGKTTLGTQGSYKLSSNFNVDYIVFNPEQFEDIIEKAKPESSILWDEAITGADVKLHANAISISIISKLTQIRKKQLKILICFPYLYMLNKYFISRCMFSVYVYAKGFNKRGYGYFYNSRETEILYNLMKEKHKYDYQRAIEVAKRSFHFKFGKTFCANVEEYEIKKDESRKNGNLDNKGNIWKGRFIKSVVYIKEDTNGKMKGLAKYLEMKPQQLTNLIHEI